MLFKSSIISAVLCTIALIGSSSTIAEARRLQAPSRELQNNNNLVPLSEVEATAYLGRWYQVYASATVVYTFEFGGNCVTADYGATTSDERKITVTNTLRPGGLAGRLFGNYVIEGYAAQSPTEDGRLSVTLPPGPFGGEIPIDEANYQDPGNYWILELGPKNADGLYSWSIVTNGSDGGQLYILVRDVADFQANGVEQTVLQKVEDYGFTSFWNRPRKTNQENCNYSR